MSDSTSIAFVFPGQGSQKIGMLAEMAERYPQIQQQFSTASSVLGYDLWGLVQKGEQETINMTEITQPLLLTASIALWQIWQSQSGATPIGLAGHSLGEWSALVAANVVSFEDAVMLVRNRGAYMQSACKPGEGAMFAVIGLDDDKVEEICREHSSDQFVAPVNYNSPGQLVIAGYAQATTKASETCKAAGAKMVVELPVSAPFHTPLMKPAADKLASDIMATAFSTPQIPIVHNSSVQTCNESSVIQSLMIEQITAAVPWTACFNQLIAMGAETVIECGPGKVLAGLGKRINRTIQTINIDSASGIQQALTDQGLE